MTPGNPPGPQGEPAAAPRWKQLLALLSLALSLLLWLNGLLDSLSRPSVGQSLNRRQLELAVLAEPHLPAPWRPLLAGPQPRRALAEALANDSNDSNAGDTPAAPALQLLRQGLERLQAGETKSIVIVAKNHPC
ncbi:MAG: hypothetical protein EB126_05100 [Synechococcaceae bacterium WBB_10_009]|nr:hypothetical protein [Synechococcaceae bacterium WBB_10_009]